MKSFLLAAVLVYAMFALTACNTMHGLGKDIEAAGEALQDVAR